MNECPERIFVDTESKNRWWWRLSYPETQEYIRADLVGEMYEALAFAKSVILSGEEWTDTCEDVIDGVLRKIRETRGMTND